MLDKILRELGWYRRPNQYVDRVEVGAFTIKDGSISPSGFLEEEDYYRIIGSKRNDGLYKHPAAELTDEAFNGAVWIMKIPAAVVDLADKVKTFCTSDAGKQSVYLSESFGGYTYTKGTNGRGGPLTWQDVFAEELRLWRMIWTEGL